MSRVSVRPNRPNDFIYDMSNISSGPKDYYKQAKDSRQMAIKYAVCPIFPSMFSDLQNYPRKQYVIRRLSPIPMYQEDHKSFSKMSRAFVAGSERYKYFHNSTTTLQNRDAAIAQEVPKLDLTGCFYDIDRERERVEKLKQFNKALRKNSKMQTDFRETSAQTSPWQPDYTVVEGDPELLKLDFLKWGQGLPAGTAEIDFINRMRSKQKTEQSFPEGHTAKDFLKKRALIEELNRVEFANRERDIEEIQSIRLELLEKMLNEVHNRTKCRSERKLRMFIDIKMAETNDKVLQVQKKAEREKRRLQLQFAGVLSKYGKVDVFEEHANYNSELYCPLMRNGTNPKYKHEKLTKFHKKYRPEYSGVERYDTKPSHLSSRAEVTEEIKMKGTRLCIRETKWTLPVLKALYEELKELRVEQHLHPNLRVCIQKQYSVVPTPEISESADVNKEMNEAATFIQKILRGRAAQNKIFIGREHCHELIDELRGNNALLKGDICKKARIREKRKEEQLNASRCLSNMKALEGSLRKLSGSTTGTLLDFLNKDLQRLLRERRAHAMILLVERLRQIREAEEAGRRQKEIRRRKEHDEMFKQTLKVHQDTVDMYLEDIITEGMEFSSENKAKEYIQSMVDKVEAEQLDLEQNANSVEREEYIAAMVHNFVIPEVEKNIVRDRMKKNQRLHLRNAHKEIYDTIEELPKPLPLAESSTTLSETTSATTEPEDVLIVEKPKQVKKRLPVDDVRSVLNELVAIPVKQAVLRELIPCTKQGADSMKTTDSEEGEEEYGVASDFDDDEKFEAVDSDDAVPFVEEVTVLETVQDTTDKIQGESLVEEDKEDEFYPSIEGNE